VAVASHLPNRVLLERAGFLDVEETDVTAEFIRVGRAWIEEGDRHREALVALLGAGEVETRQQERCVQLRAVEDGLLRRSLLVATKPIDGGLPQRSVGPARRPVHAARSR
jgi:hypothetical protein